jgi:hypothetical protein
MAQKSGDITVFYNNQNLFSEVGPVPFISFNQEFIDLKDRWNQITSLTFEGNLTGRFFGSKSFQEINFSLNRLLEKLQYNYGELKIVENYGLPSQKEIYKSPITVIESINVDQDNWNNIQPYTIQCTTYDSGLFASGYGIVEPQETFEFRDNNDNSVSFTYNVGAKGIRTNKSAIQNAKEWVLNKTGNALTYVNKYSNFRHNTYPDLRSPFVLSNIQENVNRIEGSYSIQLEFLKSNLIENINNPYLLQYNVDITSGTLENEGLLNIAINGSITNVGGSASTMMDRLRNVDIISKLYNLAIIPVIRTYKVPVNRTPVSQSIEELRDNNTINFNFIYNNDLAGNIVKDYIYSFQKDEIRNITTVSVNATIRAKYGDLQSRWNLVKNTFQNENFFNLALTQYYLEKNVKPLNRTPESESVTYDELNATINYNATWTNKFKKYDSQFTSFNSQVSFIPSYNLYVSNTSAFVVNEHNVQNLNTATRAKLNININGTLKNNITIDQGKNLMLNEAIQLRNRYIDGANVLQESSEFTFNKNISPVNLQLTEVWSFDSINIYS